MWDSAAFLCFITNNKAKEESLKGAAVDLSIVKIGGQYNTIRTVKYKLSLLDKQGKVVEFDYVRQDKHGWSDTPIQQCSARRTSATHWTC